MEKFKENIYNSRPDEDIVIYYEFEKCKEIARNNKEDENEFIIVNKNFLFNINIDYNINKDKAVIMNISKINNTKMKIEFGNNDTYINFEEKSFGFFKFIDDNLNQLDDLIENDNNNI